MLIINRSEATKRFERPTDKWQMYKWHKVQESWLACLFYLSSHSPTIPPAFIMKCKDFSQLLKPCCSLRKIPDCIPFFKSLSLISILFPGLEKQVTNFQTFSRIQDFVRTLSLMLSSKIKFIRGKVNYLTWNSVNFPLRRVNERH